MSIIELAENINSFNGNPTGILEILHKDFEETLKALKALKEKNMEDENLKKLRQNVLLIYGKDILNAPEINLRKYEEIIEMSLKAIEERLEELREKNMEDEELLKALEAQIATADGSE